MEERNVRILSGSYRRCEDKEGVEIELYGKSRNESITLLYDEFDPYFQLVEPPIDVIEELEEDDEIQDIVDRELWVDGEFKECKEVVCSYPWKVPGYRKKFRKRCEVLAADIPFVQRFTYDLDLASTVSAVGEIIQSTEFTTDAVMKVEEFKESDPQKPELSILSFDIENSLKDDRILTMGCVLESGGERERISFDGDEKEIIEEFQNYVLEKDPDIITGYNINGYDLPLLEERAEEVGLEEVCL
ncbi:MAG: 3'-5' exonuclease, partial [Candidatus Natronoplasma sp.]